MSCTVGLIVTVDGVRCDCEKQFEYRDKTESRRKRSLLVSEEDDIVDKVYKHRLIDHLDRLSSGSFDLSFYDRNFSDKSTMDQLMAIHEAQPLTAEAIYFKDEYLLDIVYYLKHFAFDQSIQFIQSTGIEILCDMQSIIHEHRDLINLSLSSTPSVDISHKKKEFVNRRRRVRQYKPKVEEAGPGLAVPVFSPESHEQVLLLQKNIRGWLSRRHYLDTKFAVHILQSKFKELYLKSK